MRWIVEHSDRPRLWKWFETVVITLAFLGLGLLISRDDPFFVESSFHWLWLGPLLVALRYGIAAGMVSVILVALLWLALAGTGIVSGPFPTNYMLGGLLMTLISAQFSSLWAQRLRRAFQVSRYASERFEHISRSYYMVRLSHDRLEQNLISRPVTLRQAMTELKVLLARENGALSKKTAGDLLSLLAHYCNLESAAIYPAFDGDIICEAAASCGKGAPCITDDLLLRSAIESGHTAYQSVNNLTPEERSTYLVAAPLRSSGGTLLGLLLVTEMPFLALHRETLQILAVLLAYVSDHAEASSAAGDLMAAYPDCPAVFAAELHKMIRIKNDLDINTALALINLHPMPQLEEICMALERQQRGLDHSWRRPLGWGVQFITLIPFSGPAAVEGYQERLNGILQRQFNLDLSSEGISFHSLMLSAEPPVTQLAALLTEKQ